MLLQSHGQQFVLRTQLNQFKQWKLLGSTGRKKKNQTPKLLFHPWLLVLLPFPPSLEPLEVIEKPLNNQAALEAAELLTGGDLVTNICAGVAKLE